MYAFQVAFDPDLLKGNELDSIRDDKGSEVTIEYIKKCYVDNAQVISLLSDYELGIFVIGLKEYQELPLVFLDSMRLWKKVKNEMKIAKERQR